MKKERVCTECGRNYRGETKACFTCCRHQRARRQREAGLTCFKCGKPPQKSPLNRGLCIACAQSRRRKPGDYTRAPLKEEDQKKAHSQNKHLIALYKAWGYSQEKIQEATRRNAT